MLRHVVCYKFTDIFAASIIRALMMEAASISKMSVNFYQTAQCKDPEDSHLQKKILFFLSTVSPTSK
jgi:hypothetical protein